MFVQVIVTAKFWFVSDLTGGQANAEAQAAKYHHCHHNYQYHQHYHYHQIIALSIRMTQNLQVRGRDERSVGEK